MNLGSAESAKYGRPKTTVICAASKLFRAFSAKKVSNGSTWADGPGYYISRLWR
jgi:hypothetical protein